MLMEAAREALGRQPPRLILISQSQAVGPWSRTVSAKYRTVTEAESGLQRTVVFQMDGVERARKTRCWVSSVSLRHQSYDRAKDASRFI